LNCDVIKFTDDCSKKKKKKKKKGEIEAAVIEVIEVGDRGGLSPVSVSEYEDTS
jgi:hypothetical protein